MAGWLVPKRWEQVARSLARSLTVLEAGTAAPRQKGDQRQTEELSWAEQSYPLCLDVFANGAARFSYHTMAEKEEREREREGDSFPGTGKPINVAWTESDAERTRG